MNVDYKRGWYAAMDKIMNFLNSFDTEGLTVDEVRRRIYKECMNEC